MHKIILEFLEKKNVIYCKQFGFHAKHSTDHAILSITNLIQHAIDCQEYGDIYLDFSKAFNAVNLNIFIEKQIIMAFVVQSKIGSSLILPTDINMFPWGKLSLNLNLSLMVFLKAQFLALYYF